MPGMRAALRLAALLAHLAVVFTAAPGHADPMIGPSPPCAASFGLSSPPTDPSTAPADWTQDQINAVPGGGAIRDRDAYRLQVTEFYQQHLIAYTNQNLRLEQDVALLNQFRLNSEAAKVAIVRGGGSVLDPYPSSWPATPMAIGTRDLTLLANQVAIDRAALAKSCDALEQDRLILDRLRSNR